MLSDKLAFDATFADQRAGILRALGNPVRLRIVALLGDTGEQSVGAIATALKLPQAKISQQLTALRLNGLVNMRKENHFHIYSLALPQMVDLLACLTRSCPDGSRV